MTPERDAEEFAHLIEALRPWLGRVVIIGGWAHRLFRHHPLAQALPYAPLMTRDADVALSTGVPSSEQNLRERLLSFGLHEKFLGSDRPPATHYHLGEDDLGFYVKFLTPLLGSEFKRNQRRDATTTLAGVTAQKLRYLEILLIEPWSVHLDVAGQSGESLTRIKVANPVTYIVHKILASGKRKSHERAKDVLYIHDTLELFGGSMPELSRVWMDDVCPRLQPLTEAKVQQARRRLFGEVTDTIRDATLMAAGRVLSPEGFLEVCQAGINRILT